MFSKRIITKEYNYIILVSNHTPTILEIYLNYGRKHRENHCNKIKFSGFSFYKNSNEIQLI
jgi:hypothetical protein